jgi:hypothetical protein
MLVDHRVFCAGPVSLKYRGTNGVLRTCHTSPQFIH